MINNTVWDPIKDFENIYEISNKGEVRNIKTGKILRQSRTTTGYKKVELSNKGKRKSFKVHRLVGIAFIKNPYKYPIINHLDGDPNNNCFENLEWCDQSRNVQHAYENGMIPSNLHKYKNTLIKEYKETNISLRCLSKKYGVSYKSLRKMLLRNGILIRSISESKDIYKIDKHVMVKMFISGKTNKEIASYFKTNKRLIATYRCKHKKGELKI